MGLFNPPPQPLRSEGHIPPLEGVTGWLNSEPLDSVELRGHVVLVNFWTLTCIYWLRQEPYVRAWSHAYRDDGLIVVGVHTPEFPFEHDIDGVRRATEERAIDYPVALDNDYEVWSAFANHYWPALYFVDADGVIRDQHFGEGRYEQSERLIQHLLDIEREPVSVEGLGVEAEADWEHLRTPETYLLAPDKPGGLKRPRGGGAAESGSCGCPGGVGLRGSVSAGSDGEGVEVVGEDRPAGPGLHPVMALQA